MTKPRAPRPPGRPKGVKERRGRRPKGEGSLRERTPGVWQFRVRHDGRAHARTVHGTRADAVAAMAEFRAELAKRGGVSRDGRTVYDLSAEWWRQYAAPGTKLARRTLEGHALQLRRWIHPHLGHIRLDRLRARDIDLMFRAMRQAGLSTGSIKRCHAVLSLMLKQALRWDWIDADPLVKADVPRHRRREIHPPATSDLEAILHAAPEGQWKTLFRVAAATGMRRGELCGLRWEDVNWERSTLFVRRAVVATRTGGVELKGTKTNRSRIVPLDPVTVAALAGEYRRRVELDGDVEGFVFSPGLGERPFSPDSVTQQFGRLRVKAGVAGVRLHDLRHWHASHLLRSGQPVTRVQHRLGHDNAATTLEFYAHLVEDVGAVEAAEVIGELLSGGGALPPLGVDSTHGEG